MSSPSAAGVTLNWTFHPLRTAAELRLRTTELGAERIERRTVTSEIVWRSQQLLTRLDEHPPGGAAPPRTVNCDPEGIPALSDEALTREVVETLTRLYRAFQRPCETEPEISPGARWPELEVALHGREVRLNRAMAGRIRAELADLHARARYLALAARPEGAG